MKLLNLMSNQYQYDLNSESDPIDNQGEKIDMTNIKRGERLNAKAKENIKLTLYNNKDLISK